MEITFGGHTIAFGPEMSPRQKTSVLDAVTKTYQTTAIEVEHESRKLLAEKIEEMKELYWLMIGKTADEYAPNKKAPGKGGHHLAPFYPSTHPSWKRYNGVICNRYA